jgi:1-acyl-sn-glycerol-3-phosphate acyltransferase
VPPLYTLADSTVGAALRLGWRPVVEGLDAVPRHGGVLLAANHSSIADQLFLGSVLPRHVAFWAKSEYFTAGGPWGRLTRAVLHGLGAIPVDRSGGGAADSAFAAAVPVLRGGGVVAVFPEGTRSPDGRLYRGRTGIARLALMTGAPVVPFAMIGTDKIQPGGAGMPRPSKVTVRFGPAMEFSRYDGMDRDRYVLRAVTDSVMAEVMRLSGQEYVDMYATKAKAA